MTNQPTIYGAPYSVYVKIVRLALLEKGVDYTLNPIDIFTSKGVPQSYLKRHPFGKIPAFSHCGFDIYETSAITDYINLAFPDPPLMPNTPVASAKARQIISIFDNYAYQSMVWGIYVPSTQTKSDDTEKPELQKHIKIAEAVISVLSNLAAKEKPFLMGDEVMLPDLYAVPMIDYFIKTDIGTKMVSNNKRIKTWWDAISSRRGYEDILDEG